MIVWLRVLKEKGVGILKGFGIEVFFWSYNLKGWVLLKSCIFTHEVWVFGFVFLSELTREFLRNELSGRVLFSRGILIGQGEGTSGLD